MSHSVSLSSAYASAYASARASAHWLVDGIANRPDTDGVQSHISIVVGYLRNHYNLPEITGDAMAFLKYVWKMIFKVSKVSTQITETVPDGSSYVQQTRISSLASLLGETLKGDFHTVTAPCIALDGKTGSCKKGNPFCENTKNHAYSCDYHTEPLFAHLVFCSLLNSLYVIQNITRCFSFLDSFERKNLCHEVFLAMFFGLYHDIGKMSTVEISETQNGTRTSFPAHGEVGAKLLLAHWSPDMQNIISYTDYIHVSQAVLRHMCGYHGAHDVNGNLYKRNLLLLDSRPVLDLLTVNRFGDELGGIHSDAIEKIDMNEFFVQQQIFRDHMANGRFSRQDVFGMLGCSPSKVLILLIGTSGSGKSTFANSLVQSFKDNITIVSRDCATALSCVGINARLTGDDYKMMYAICDASRALAILENDKKKNAKAKASESIMLKKNIIDVLNAWNSHKDQSTDSVLLDADPVPIPNVNDANDRFTSYYNNIGTIYNRMIESAMAPTNNSFFVVLDTMANCFPGSSVVKGMPDCVKNLFKIHIHVDSWTETTHSVNGLDIPAQLALSKEHSFAVPLHPDGIAAYNGRKAFTSLSAEDTKNGSAIPDAGQYSMYRPHLVALISRTVNGVIGYDYTIEILQRLLASPSPSPSSSSGSSSGSDSGAHSGSEAKDKPKANHDTTTMNIDEYFAHLLTKFDNDITSIADYLVSEGFLLKAHLYLKDYDDSFIHSISAMAKILFDLKVISKTYTFDDLKNDRIMLDRFINMIVILKYQDGKNGPQFWKNTWALQIRGTCLFIHPETLVVSVLSYKLPRGAEMLSRDASSSGKNIKSQDFDGDESIFDAEQIDTQTKLTSASDDTPFDGYLTSKVDGMLAMISCFKGMLKNVMIGVITIFGSDIAKLWMNVSLELTHNDMLVVYGTNNTLYESGFMSPWFITSMLVGSGICDRLALNAFPTPLGAFDHFGKTFLSRVVPFANDIFRKNSSTVVSFSFESVCANASGCWGDALHSELGIRYPVDRFVLLGASVIYIDDNDNHNRMTYVPHMILSQHHAIPFDEPSFWKISNVGQIHAILQGIEDVAINGSPISDFSRRFPPANAKHDTQYDGNLDLEGFVIMKVLSGSNGNRFCYDAISYSKLKLASYYIVHSPFSDPRPRNARKCPLAKRLMLTPDVLRIIQSVAQNKTTASASASFVASFFSLDDAGNVCDVIVNPNVSDILTDIITQIVPLFSLDCDAPGDTFLKMAIDLFNANPSGKNPYANIAKMPIDRAIPMILKNIGDQFRNTINACFMNHHLFSGVSFSSKNKSCFTNLVRDIAPWKDGYQGRIRDIVAKMSSLDDVIDSVFANF